MALQAIAFYLMAAVTVAAGFCVVSARNPVHSVLWLILAFFSAAGLFVLMGAEFLAMLLVVVYVGAVAVLFLFVVMMLDVDFAELRAGFIKNAPMGLFVGGLVLLELLALFLAKGFGAFPTATATVPTPEGVTNTAALGQILAGGDESEQRAQSVCALACALGVGGADSHSGLARPEQRRGSQSARQEASSSSPVGRANRSKTTPQKSTNSLISYRSV